MSQSKISQINNEEAMTGAEMGHVTVLLSESIENLNLYPGAIFFDGTLGAAGHTEKVCRSFDGKVKVIATDRDRAALDRAEKRLKSINCDFTPVLSDFRQIKKVLMGLNISEIDGVLLDLGLSSNQLDSSGRGFTFRQNEPLLMTFTDNSDHPSLTTEEVVNDWSEDTLADIIYGFSDERYGKRIARAIVMAREHKTIKTTDDLLFIIKSAVPVAYQRGKTHYATKTFQAIRMAVNDELGALRQGLEDGFEALKIGGRIAVISFHSVEDRLVKNYFRDLKTAGMAVLINKKPIIPTRQEIINNPRSRSAKLRIIEKVRRK